MPVEFREAVAQDAEAIAKLHAESWRSAYRGIFSDEFLDGEAIEDRRREWHHRLDGGPCGTQFTLLAESDGELIGFICVYLDADPKWGAVVDNLHVQPEWKGRNIGRSLLGAGAAWVRSHRPESPLHLWVYEKNIAAQRFYDRMGGSQVERVVRRASDGGDVASLRYVWRRLARLMEPY